MIKNLLIDPDCLGKTMYLASVAPYYKYDAQKQKTNEIEGYRYEVALAEKGISTILANSDLSSAPREDAEAAMCLFGRCVRELAEATDSHARARGNER